jgi:hypothetical protein
VGHDDLHNDFRPYLQTPSTSGGCSKVDGKRSTFGSIMGQPESFAAGGLSQLGGNSGDGPRIEKPTADTLRYFEDRNRIGRCINSVAFITTVVSGGRTGRTQRLT